MNFALIAHSTKWTSSPNRHRKRTRYKLFYMPTEASGAIKAIAVSRQEGALFTSGYSVLLTLMLGALWKLILYLVLVFFPSVDS